MTEKRKKHYPIKFYFTDSEDFSKVLEYHFLLFIRKLKKT